MSPNDRYIAEPKRIAAELYQDMQNAYPGRSVFEPDPPLVQGGQGRTDADTSDGSAMLGIVFLTILLMVAIAIGFVLGRVL